MRLRLFALSGLGVLVACGGKSDAGTEDASVVGAGGDSSLDDAARGIPATDGTVEDTGPIGKTCATLPDGTLCGAAPDACHDAPACESGVCADPPARADGTVCAPAPDACHAAGTCAAGACSAVTTEADGFEWMAGDATARCCGGKPIHTTTNDDCGVCGVQCNAANGESCDGTGGVYLCRGCVASDACWSKCCSTSFTPYACSASDCAGNCDPSLCPPGAHCVTGTTTSDYCSY